VPAVQKTPKPRCKHEVEEGGGSHSWFTQCSRAEHHTGEHRYHLSFKEMLAEGTAVYNIERETKCREQEIVKHHEQIAKLQEEIKNLRTKGEP